MEDAHSVAASAGDTDVSPPKKFLLICILFEFSVKFYSLEYEISFASTLFLFQLFLFNVADRIPFIRAIVSRFFRLLVQVVTCRALK